MRLTVSDVDKCVGCQQCMFACARLHGEVGFEESCIHVKSAGGMERGFKVIVCNACIDPPCAKVCPTDALIVQKGGGVRLNPDKCIGCGNCVDACIIGAVFWDDDTNKPRICSHCGYCAKYCPHGVLELIANRGGE